MLEKTLVMLSVLVLGIAVLSLLFWRDRRRAERERREKDE